MSSHAKTASATRKDTFNGAMCPAESYRTHRGAFHTRENVNISAWLLLLSEN